MRIRINDKEKERLETFTCLMEKNLKSGIAEGWRRTANLFDDLNFIYSAVSSGKDSVFMTQICIMELQRRRYITSLWLNDQKDEAKAVLNRYSSIRECGLASNRTERVETPEDEERLFGENGIFSKHLNMRIGVMSMDYELTFKESREVKLRFWKEYATEFSNILPQGKTLEEMESSEKTVKELGFDLRWVSPIEKENPAELSLERFEKMTTLELESYYGKALVFGFEMMFPIAWQNLGSASDSRYLSFDPEKKNLWVTIPPVEQDAYKEWCMVYENMYDSFHGLPPMLQIAPGLSDQKLRVEFSKFISESIPYAISCGWPEKKYNEKTGQFI